MPALPFRLGLLFSRSFCNGTLMNILYKNYPLPLSQLNTKVVKGNMAFHSYKVSSNLLPYFPQLAYVWIRNLKWRALTQPTRIFNYLQVKPTGLRAIAAILPKPSHSAAPPKKKLFLTDGWQLPLTGICIYMFRLNTGKQLPEEGFHKVGLKY